MSPLFFFFPFREGRVCLGNETRSDNAISKRSEFLPDERYTGLRSAVMSSKP